MSDSMSFYESSNGSMRVNTGSPEDQLAASLDQRQMAKRAAETQRKSDVITAKARVDAIAPLGNVGSLVLEVMAEGVSVADDLYAKINELNDNHFPVYRSNALNEWYSFLMQSTGRFYGYMDDAAAAFPTPAIPAPNTTADWTGQSARLQQLASASPEEAKGIVNDAVAREDIPFLHAAGSQLRSGLSHGNKWQPSPAQQIAVDLLQTIDEETWSPDAEAALYSKDRIDAFTSAWIRFVNTIKSDMKLDPIWRQSGALAPMLLPLDNSSVDENASTQPHD